MEKTTRSHLKLLALAGSSWLALSVAASAQIAPPAITFGSPSIVTAYLHSLANTQLDTSAISASVLNALIQNQTNAAPNTPVNGAPFTGVTTSDSIFATAAGNAMTKPQTLVSLALLGNDGVNDGIAASNLQTVQGASVTSLVAGGAIASVASQTGGAITTSSNSILAGATLNSATPAFAIGGALPGAYTPLAFTPAGATTNAILAFNAATTSRGSAAGSLNAASIQIALGDTAAAQVRPGASGSSITSSDLVAPDSSVASIVSTNGNTINAQFIGDQSSDSIAAVSGAAAFAGSANATNIQILSGLGLGGAPANASVAQAAIATTIGASDRSSTFTGVLTQTGDTIGASAIGNQAQGVTITLAGVDLQPLRPASAQTNAQTFTAATSTAAPAAAGDVIAVNVQGVSNSPISALTSQATIAAVVDSLAGPNPDVPTNKGVVSVTSDAITAIAAGSTAVTGVSAGAAATKAVVGVSSGQYLLNSPIAATLLNGAIQASAISPAGASGVILVDSNTLTANATGASAASTLTLGAASLAGPSVNGAAVLQSATGSQSAAADFSLLNQQITNAPIDSTLVGGAIGIATAGPFTNGSLTLTNSSAVATANAATAANAIALTGSTGTFASALANQQIDLATHTFATANTAISVVGVGASNTTTTVSGDQIGSNARSLVADNSLSATQFASLGATDYSGAISGPGSVMSGLAVLANQQTVNAGFESSNTAGFIGATNGAATVFGGVTTVANDSLTANAQNDVAANSLTLQAATLTGSAMAALNNQQSSTGSTAVAVQTKSAIGQIAGSLSGSTSSVTGDIVQATAALNSADSTLNVRTAGAASFGAGASSGTGLLLNNAQNASNTGVVVLVNETALTTQSIGVTTGAITASTLTIANGALTARGAANAASNSLNITAATLTAGEPIALLANAQSSLTNVSGRVDGGRIGLTGASVAGSIITVDQATLLASAIENDAANALVVTGSNVVATPGVGPSFGLTNTQSGAGGSTATVTGSAGPSLGVSLTGAAPTTTGSTVTVTNGSALADARENRAINTLAVGYMDAGNVLTAAPLASYLATDSVTNAQSSASSVFATVGSAAAPLAIGAVLGTISSSPVTVSGDAAQTQAIPNAAGNALFVNAATISGSKAGATGSVALTGVSPGVADHLVSSFQTNVSGAGATTTATIAVSGVSANASPLTVNADAITALTQADSANNALNLSAANTITTSGLILNGQYALGSTSATANGTIGALFTGAIAGAPVTVTNNVISAATLGDTASNVVSVGGATTAGVLAPDAAPSSSGATGVPGSAATGKADYAIVNQQRNAEGGVIGGSATVTGAVTVSAASLNSAPLTLSNNTIAARSTSNTAINQIDLAASLVTATTSLVNQQATDPQTVVVTTNGAVGAAIGSLANGGLTLAGNAIDATATGNVATNATKLAGGAAVNNPTPASTQFSTAAAGSSASAAGGATLTSNQFANTLVLSATTTGSVSSTPATITGPAQLTFDSNVVSANAASNSVVNTLELAAATLTSQGAIANVQATNFGSASAAVTNATIGAPLLNPAAITTASIGVTNNQAAARASGNAASNTLTASATNGYGVHGGPTQVALNAPLNNGSASASYTVLNAQTNGAIVTASVGSSSTPTTIGLSAVPGFAKSSAAVTGNAVLAAASGNTADNLINLASLPSGTASGALANSQVNTASISAAVTNVTIGSMVGSGAAGSSATVANNSVGASAVGNSAVNNIRAK